MWSEVLPASGDATRGCSPSNVVSPASCTQLRYLHGRTTPWRHKRSRLADFARLSSESLVQYMRSGQSQRRRASYCKYCIRLVEMMRWPPRATVVSDYSSMTRPKLARRKSGTCVAAGASLTTTFRARVTFTFKLLPFSLYSSSLPPSLQVSTYPKSRVSYNQEYPYIPSHRSPSLFISHAQPQSTPSIPQCR